MPNKPTHGRARQRIGITNRPHPNTLLRNLHAEYRGATLDGLRESVIEMRRQGLCVGDIADRVYPGIEGGIARVHLLLEAAPRRLEFRFGGEVVEGDAAAKARRPFRGQSL